MYNGRISGCRDTPSNGTNGAAIDHVLVAAIRSWRRLSWLCQWLLPLLLLAICLGGTSGGLRILAHPFVGMHLLLVVVHVRVRLEGARTEWTRVQIDARVRGHVLLCACMQNTNVSISRRGSRSQAELLTARARGSLNSLPQSVQLCRLAE